MDTEEKLDMACRIATSMMIAMKNQNVPVEIGLGACLQVLSMQGIARRLTHEEFVKEINELLEELAESWPIG